MRARTTGRGTPEPVVVGRVTDVIEGGLVLSSTSDLVQVTSATAADLLVHAAWTDRGSVVEAGRKNTPLTTAATATVVTSPAASVQRLVTVVIITNADTTDASVVTVELTDGAFAARLWKGLLLPGESVAYTANGWARVSSGGRPSTGAARRSVNVQSKTTAGPGTWTKPTAFKPTSVLVLMWGAGGGGGGGHTSAAGVRSAGGGGAGAGAFHAVEFAASDLPDTVSYTVGAGGAGGTGAPSGGAATAGTHGGNTTFFGLVAYGGGDGGPGFGTVGNVSAGGGGGSGGAPNTASWDERGGVPGLSNESTQGANAGSGGRVLTALAAERGGGAGGYNSGVVTFPGAGSLFGGGGGGAGGERTAAGTVLDAQPGGGSNSYDRGTGGAAGTSGAVPTPGSPGLAGNSTRGGAGGGGGGASTSAGVSGEDGGDGGGYGGGGAGGGGGTTGGSGGSGGNGGDGAIYIYTW